jgi:hypothetical protein
MMPATILNTEVVGVTCPNDSEAKESYSLVKNHSLIIPDYTILLSGGKPNRKRGDCSRMTARAKPLVRRTLRVR